MLLNLRKQHRRDIDKIYLYIKDAVKPKFNQIIWLEKFWKKFYGSFLWMGFNCLKARAT